MFLATQLIGLAVINAYTTQALPYNMQPPELKTDEEYWGMVPMIVLAFIIAIALFFLLTRIKLNIILRLWFFIVIILAVGITLNSLFSYFSIPYTSLIAALVALPLAFFKIFKRNFIVHNLTELMIYPGIAAVFVPILNIWTIIILLILISAYDIYAVWHSGFMQKMAKFQINKLKFFAGFFVPYLGQKERKKIKTLRQKYKKKGIPEKELKKKKIKVNLAILGGGDVIFPIIAAGVFFKVFGLISALFITAGATIALFALFTTARKGKFYPAMPFISAGIFIGMILSWLIL
jgi:presenilin-like A22 family membrane protease